MRNLTFTVILVLGSLLVGAGCQSRPINELIFADVALKAAQKAKAENLATDLYRKAENNFLRAKRDYDESYFDSCRKFATEARILAEQAEYQAVLRQVKMQQGGVKQEEIDTSGSY